MAALEKNMKKIDYRAELKEEYARWKRLFCQGGQDPFWPDGVNLNLIRNHITACRAALEQEDKTVPEEYGWLLPPEVPPDYMARGKEIWYRGMESYKKYTADENYQYLKEVSDTLPEKVKKESSIENVLGREEPGQSKENGICRAGIGISGMDTGCYAGTNCDETLFQMAVRRSRNHYGIWNPIPANLYAGLPGYDGTMGV